jgi:endonuclease/exonuclease/phosphatase family metal-dependent hydrolase
MIRFRVATYNIHKSRGIDWRTQPGRILHVLREIDADLIALQEIFDNQHAFLAEHLQLNEVFGSARELNGMHYGNAILSRFPITETTNHDITVAGREPRRCLQANIELSAVCALHFFALHLGTSFFERRHQARLLLSSQVLEQSNLSAPRLVVGDFNEWTRGQATSMLSQRLQSADVHAHLKRRRTYPGILPFWHLDHVYYDQQLILTSMQLHKSKTALAASDHLPLVGDFELL